MPKNRRAKIAAMSRKFLPDFKRLWYIVGSEKGYRVRYEGHTIPVYFPDFNGALIAAQLLIRARYEDGKRYRR